METFRFNPIKHLRSIHTICLIMMLSGIFSFTAVAAENEERVPSTITNVTVFLNQAQVTRVAKVSLQAGVTHLVFDRVSPYINLNSIQVKTESNVTLLSVSQRNNFLLSEEKPTFILNLEDTLEALTHQLALINIRREALVLEKEVLAANKHIGGSNAGVKVEDLEDALTLFRKRTQEIGEELLKLNNQTTRLNTIHQKFKSQLDEYLNNKNGTVEVVVTLKALSPVNNTKVEWSYLVGNTSWTPFYDIRVKDTKSPIELVSKAYITQQTGEDWKNVILKLSTANPNESGSKPELDPLRLGFVKPEIKPIVIYEKRGRADIDAQDKAEEDERFDSAVSENAWGTYSPSLSLSGSGDGYGASHFSTGIGSVFNSDINVEFNVTSAYTIPSDNNPHQVDLTVSKLNGNYAYAAIPKLDKDAFVTVQVAGSDLVNQISGEANIYFDGTYTGKTYINGTSSDSALLSLGRDKRIQIQRTLLKDFSSKNFSGGSKKELNTWEISLRNTRKEPITIIVEDQIPVSTDKDIEVKLLNNGGATYDETTGKLTWRITLEAEKSQVLRFSFEIKYPKEKQLQPY